MPGASTVLNNTILTLEQMGRFFGEIGGEVEYYYYYLAFFICVCYLASRSVMWCLECTKFSLGLCLGPNWGISWHSPRLPSRQGNRILSPHFPLCRHLYTAPYFWLPVAFHLERGLWENRRPWILHASQSLWQSMHFWCILYVLVIEKNRI